MNKEKSKNVIFLWFIQAIHSVYLAVKLIAYNAIVYWMFLCIFSYDRQLP